jgi:hypothetical protein
VAWDCMTTSISCVLFERGIFSVLERIEEEQIGMRVENRRLKLENGKETLNAEGAENAEFAEKRRRRPTRNTGV